MNRLCQQRSCYLLGIVGDLVSIHRSVLVSRRVPQLVLGGVVDVPAEPEVVPGDDVSAFERVQRRRRPKVWMSAAMG